MTNITADQIVVVAEDPGGANLVASYVLKNQLIDRCRFVLTGPAVSLFREILGPVRVESIELLESVPVEDSLLLCATSLNHQSVVSAIHRARQLGVRSVAYLDHWANYAIRFGAPDEWMRNLPDEVWLTDEYAVAQARSEGFPKERLRTMGDPYLRQVTEAIKSRRTEDRTGPVRVLYLSEVLEEAPIPGGPSIAEYRYDGASILRDIAEAVVALNGEHIELKVRQHPAEAPDKYDRVIGKLDPKLSISKSDGLSLADDIAASDIVVGAQTTALVVALESGVRTISYIPAGGIPCQLPHHDLIRLSKISELSEVVNEVLTARIKP